MLKFAGGGVYGNLVPFKILIQPILEAEEITDKMTQTFPSSAYVLIKAVG